MRTYLTSCLLSIGLITAHLSCKDQASTCVSSSQQAIVNGTPVSRDSIPAQVVLILYGKGIVRPSCTGVLLTHEWVLTAKHCLFDDVPSNHFIFFGSDLRPLFQLNPPSSDTQTRAADRLIPNPDDFMDVALMHVADPFMIDGKSNGYQLDIDKNSSSNLFGKELTLLGYGCANADGSGLDGQLRKANLVVDGVGAGILTFSKNALQQSACQGDSGGPLLLSGNHTLGGIVSKVNTAEGITLGVSVFDFRQWVLSQAKLESPMASCE